MTRLARLLPSLAAFALAACADPTAPAGGAPPRASAAGGEGTLRSVAEHVYDLSGTLTMYTCADGTESELIAMHGAVYHKVTQRQTPTGMVHYQEQSMPVGLGGVGVESGHAYRIVERHQMNVRITPEQQAGFYRDSWTIRNAATGASAVLVFAIHWRFEPDGDLDVSRELERAGCM